MEKEKTPEKSKVDEPVIVEEKKVEVEERKPSVGRFKKLNVVPGGASQKGKVAEAAAVEEKKGEGGAVSETAPHPRLESIGHG